MMACKLYFVNFFYSLLKCKKLWQKTSLQYITIIIIIFSKEETKNGSFRSEADSLEPVSYTHLDVYKRQRCKCSRR